MNDDIKELFRECIVTLTVTMISIFLAIWPLFAASVGYVCTAASAQLERRSCMYHANTIEQFKIRNWLEDNFAVPYLKQVEVLGRNAVRITDREGAMAIVHCDKDGVIQLETIDETA